MRTKMRVFSMFIFLCVIARYNVANAERILAIAHIPSYSHQISYRRLFLELNKRGHEMVVITPNPVKNSSLTNYTEIDLSYMYSDMYSDTLKNRAVSLFDSFMQLSFKYPLLKIQNIIWDIIHIVNEMFFETPEVKKLCAADSKEHFDAVIVAQGPNPSINAFAYRFNAPLIGISSLDVFNHLRFMLGFFILPSHLSNWESNIITENNMSFWIRLVNFCEVWKQMYYWMNKYIPMENALVEKYFGKDMPDVADLTKNMSIYFVNRHRELEYARTEHPNIIFFHGFHIAEEPPTLPQNIKQFVDNAKEGFIYLSLGTNVKWENLPNHIFETFIAAFSALPYKVLWKYNPNLLKSKNFTNILVSNWLPQQGVLAHPNIKLFFYQGGIQSTEEAIYYGIPVIGFPIMWDQIHQMQKMVRLGVGLYLHHNNISKKVITDAVHEVINNKRYREKVKRLSKLYRDVPYDPLQNAVWWVEYVMRNNGTFSLRNTLADMSWYQQYEWDIIAFLAITIFTIFLISLYTLFQMLRFIYACYRGSSKCHIKPKKE